MKPANTVIALVENDIPTQRAFTRLLRAHGFTVEAFASAELLLASTALGSARCLLLDIDLDGMSGLDLQQHLIRAAIEVPVIFITGRDDPAASARAHQQGCHAFLYKPVQAQMLVEAITSTSLPF